MKKIDCFGQPFTFTVFGEENYKSMFGAFLTLLASVVMVCIFLLFGSDFLYKKNPMSNSALKQRSGNQIKYHPVTNRNFTLMFKIEDSDGLLIGEEDTIFHPILDYKMYTRNTQNDWELDSQATPTPVPCSQTDAKYNPHITGYNLDTWLCFDWDQVASQIGKPPVFGGLWENDKVVTFSIYFNSCKFNTDSMQFEMSTCSSKRKITDKLAERSQYFSIVMPDSRFDSTDHENPLKVFYNYAYFLASPNIFLTKYYYFTYVNVFDDQGWIFDETELSTSLEIEKQKDLIAFVGDSDFEANPNQSYFGFVPYLLNDERVHYRRYVKLQQVVANVGGMLKIVLLLFKTINYFVTDRMRRLELLSRVTLLDEESVDKNNSEVELKSAENSKLNFDLRKRPFFYAITKDVFCFSSKKYKYLRNKEKEVFKKIDVLYLLNMQLSREESFSSTQKSKPPIEL